MIFELLDNTKQIYKKIFVISYILEFILFCLITGGWEFDGIPTILDKLASSCGELRGLSLTGWQGLSAEHVKFLISHCPKLQRLDLSSINVSEKIQNGNL